MLKVGHGLLMWALLIIPVFYFLAVYCYWIVWLSERAVERRFGPPRYQPPKTNGERLLRQCGRILWWSGYLCGGVVALAIVRWFETPLDEDFDG